MSTLIKKAVEKFFSNAKRNTEETFSLTLGGVGVDEETRAWIIANCPKNVQLGADILENING